jgi:hypothetical protein
MEIATTVDTKIDEIIRDNKIFRYALELQNTTDVERKELIKLKLINLQGITPKELSTTVKTKLDTIYDNIDSFTLKQKWTKLKDKQKMERIKLFIESSDLSSSKKIQLDKTIIEMIKNKTFKIAYIDYDSKNGKILSINIPDFKYEDSDSNSESESEYESELSDSE